ncbi:MAG: PEP-CTERM sorting domain-containing protein [Janthinobacterium lividum]
MTLSCKSAAAWARGLARTPAMLLRSALVCGVLVCGVLLGLAAAGPAGASVLYSSPASTASTASPAGAPGSDSATQDLFSLADTIVAQQFRLGTGAQLAALNVYAGFDPLQQAPVRLDWHLYHDGPGMPGTLLAQGSSTAMFDNPAMFSLTAYQVTGKSDDFAVRIALPLPDIDLAAGNYWLGLHVDGLPASQGCIHWLPALLPPAGAQSNVQPSAISRDRGSTWQAGRAALAFELNGQFAPLDTVAPVPEPATMLLFGCGLLGLALQLRYLQRYRAQGKTLQHDADAVAVWPASGPVRQENNGRETEVGIRPVFA